MLIVKIYFLQNDSERFLNDFSLLSKTISADRHVGGSKTEAQVDSINICMSMLFLDEEFFFLPLDIFLSSKNEASDE